MSEFTYELPDNKSFFNTITTILKSDPKYAGYKYYNIVKTGIAKYQIPAISQVSVGMQCTRLLIFIFLKMLMLNTLRIFLQ